MTIATLPLDCPTSALVPDHRQADLFLTIRDPARLAFLRRLALLDTPAEQAFDRLTRLATRILRAPVALLSLVDGDRSFFKSSVGLPELWASRREIPLSQSVCQHVVAANAPLVINDARAHPLVSDNQAIANLQIVAYLGIPLVTSEGYVLGTFAAIDTVPRKWTSDDVTTLADLADSAMTEIELRAESNQRLDVEKRLHLFESVVDNAAAVLIVEADSQELSDLRIVFVNDAYTRLTGYTSDEIVGSIHQVLNSAETDRSQADTIRRALATQKPAHLEFLMHRKDGTAFWADSNIVPIADKYGRYSHWVIILRNISEQKATEAALRESENRRQTIQESSLDCIITVDQLERVIEFNGAAETTFGYSRKAVLGKPLVELIVPPHQGGQGGNQTLGLGERAASEENSLLAKRLEMTGLRADGTTFPAELAFTNTRLEGSLFTAFLRDISERKRGERLLAAQYDCTRILADSVVMDETIPKILQAICERLGWTLGQMWQLDSKADVLRCVAAWHDPAAAVAAFVDLCRNTTFQLASGLPGRVWASREPVWLSDMAHDASFPRAEEAILCGLHTGFAFPILQGEKVLGVMEFLHQSILKPDGPLLAMVNAIGSQVGQFMERMRTEEARQRSEQRHRSLVLASSQIVWIADSAGQLILEDSSTWLTFTGQTAEQAQGFGWLDALHPDDRARTAQVWTQGIARKAFCQAEYRLRTATGEYRHMVARAVPVLGADGQVAEWVGMNTDITEQKAAEEGLRRTVAEMRRLALIVQCTDNAVILTDRLGHIEWVNAGFTRLCEYHLEEVVGKTPGKILQGPDTDQVTVTHMHEQLLQGKGFEAEIINYARSGRAYWAAIEVRPILDDQGSLTGFMAIESDITARKRTDEILNETNKELEIRVVQRTAELSEANEFFKALLENIQDGIVACNSNGVITLLNRTVRELHHLPELPTHPSDWSHFYGLYHADGHTPMTADDIPLNRALRGECVHNAEVVVVTKEGGAVHTILANGRAVYDEHGKKLGAVVSLNDVTERKRAEMELQKAHDELEHRVETRTAQLAVAKDVAETANRAKSEFFSRMSHELRTPLNVILGFGQLLEMDTLSGPQRESAEQIGKGGRHLLTLVNEVLDIARIEAGRAGIMSLEDVDLHEVVEGVLGMIQPLADAAGVQILPPQPETWDRAVLADLQRLKQVLLNLLSNGIKYNRKGGTLAISCAEASGEMLRISVTDTGPGIAPEKMHRLFVAFDRLDADKKGVEGTGLGLTLAKGLMEAMHGKIGVESTLGKGSTFWIELSRIDTTNQLAAGDLAPVADPADHPTTAGTVLCVEDNPANFRLIERIMKFRPAVRLLSATQGRLGIDLAREHHPDLIFLDLHLPDLQGGEVLRQLQADPATRDIPVIMLSADATPHQIELLRAAGAMRYMVKPLDVREFLQVMDETLKRKED